MAEIVLNCPHCKFQKQVPSTKIPTGKVWVTCPKCSHKFVYSPPSLTAPRTSPPRVVKVDATAGLSGDVKKSGNALIALLFILIFGVLLGLRLYSADRALKIAGPNQIAASSDGVASVWGHRLIVTDINGHIVWEEELPEYIRPVALTWAEGKVWVGDYDSKRIWVADRRGGHWLWQTPFNIRAHFKIVPDLSRDRIYVSDGAGHRIFVYDAEGALRNAFGHEGTEDGEFLFPNDFFLMPSGELAIGNTNRMTVDLYSGEGEFIRVLCRTLPPELANNAGTDSLKALEAKLGHYYPTDVVISGDSIITLDSDAEHEFGFVRKYSADGALEGKGEEVLRLHYRDIALLDDRLILTHDRDRKITTLSAEDLSPVGDFSHELSALAASYQREFEKWENLSGLSIKALGVLFAVVLILYLRYRRKIEKTGEELKAPADGVQQTADQVLATATVIEPKKRWYVLPALILLPIVSLVLMITFAAMFRGQHVPAPLLLIPVVAAGVLTWLVQLSPTANFAFRKHLRRMLKQTLRVCPNSMRVTAVASSAAKGWNGKRSTSIQQGGIVILFGEYEVRFVFLSLPAISWLTKVTGHMDIAYRELAVADATIPLMNGLEIIADGKKITVLNADKRFVRALRTEFDTRIAAAKVKGEDHRPVELRSNRDVPPLKAIARGRTNLHAALLSLILPGLGQFYNREIGKGGIMLLRLAITVITLGLLWEPVLSRSAANWKIGTGFLLVYALTIIFLYWSSIADAYRGGEEA